LYVTFLKHGFTVYANAHSNYFWTVNSLTSLMNFKVVDEDQGAGSWYPAIDGRFISAGGMFDYFARRGYAISAYWTNEIWNHSDAPILKKEVRFLPRLGALHAINLSWKDRWVMLASRYASVTPALKLVFQRWHPKFLEYTMNVSQLAGKETWEIMKRDILSEGNRRQLFFGYFFTPHGPYLFYKSGEVRPITEWRFFQPLFAQRDPASYIHEHREYAEQVQYLNSELDRLFSELADAGVLDSARIIVHGDHGARILGKVNSDSGPEELLETYSTLLAVKESYAESGRINHRKGSVASFLAELLPDPDRPALDFDWVRIADTEGRFVHMKMKYPDATSLPPVLPPLQRWTQGTP
jgi:hypothetical protein